MNGTLEATSTASYRMAAEPAFNGYIESTFDALLIFEACQRGLCARVTRRLHERERRLIGSGSVYVFDERDTGIKRWTDGRVWSPSRILQNFLVYRELDKRAQPSGPPSSSSSAVDPSAHQQQHPSAGYVPHPEPGPSSGSVGASGVVVPANRSPPEGLSPSLSTHELPSLDRSRERALVGSLTSSYRFRADGLVKKTISVSGLHMISYYRMDDVLQGRLRTPSSVPELQALDISPNFLVNQNFRVPPQIEFGPDGRPRYRGEGDGSQPQLQHLAPQPPHELSTAPPTGSASAYSGLAFNHSASPAHQPLVPLPASYEGHQAGSAEALQPPSSSVARSRPAYIRAHSSTDSSHHSRSAAVGIQAARYDPYARPGSSSSSSQQHYYPSGAQPSPTYTTFSSMGDVAGRAAQPWGSAGPQTGSSHRGSYYEGSPPNSAVEPRSFDSLQQHGLYPPHRMPPGAAEASYYRSASVPPQQSHPSGVYGQPARSSPRLVGEPVPASAAGPSSTFARAESVGAGSHYHYITSPALSAATTPRYSEPAPHAHPSQHHHQPPRQVAGTAPYAPPSYGGASSSYGSYHHPSSLYGGAPGTADAIAGPHQSYERAETASSSDAPPLLSPETQPRALQHHHHRPGLVGGGVVAPATAGSVCSDASGPSSTAGSVTSASGAPRATSSHHHHQQQQQQQHEHQWAPSSHPSSATRAVGGGAAPPGS